MSEARDITEAKQGDVVGQADQASETSAIMSVIERVATNPDADINKLEKMLEMQERVLERNAKAEFDAALADMQSELPEVERKAQGHNSMYAKFEHILAAIKPVMQKHGFSITHRVKVEDGIVMITGILSHRSGHREETTLPLPPDNSGNKNAVQAIASSTEYGRRYTMNSLIGIATREADKDGGSPDEEPDITDALAAIDGCSTLDELKKVFEELKSYRPYQNAFKRIVEAKDKKKKELTND